MKRTATSASRCLERITSGTPTTYSTTARRSRIARGDIDCATSSSQQSRRLALSSSRPTSNSYTTPSHTLRSPAQRAYTTTQTQHSSSSSQEPPPSSSSSTRTSHLREDINSNSNSSPSQPRTHYTLFPLTLPNGPPPSGPFTINLSALKREFLQLQAIAHPDRHSGANKLRAEAASSAINEAYKTLEDPLRRANYLLELKGWETEECDKMGGEFVVPGHGDMHPGQGGGALGEASGGDMELLMEVMEAREAVEEAESEEEVAQLKAENEERIQGSVRVLEEAFANEDLARAKRESVRLRYWRNIGESLREWEGKGSQHVLQH